MGQYNSTIIIGVAIAYVAMTSGIAIWTQKMSRTSSKFMTGGKDMGVFIVGVYLMSQWVAAGAVMGTAETAFSKGISASWNLATIAIAQVLFGVVMAKKYHDTGEYSISGVMEKKYGQGARTITSLLMIYAMSIVNVSFYVGGAATLAAILGLSPLEGLLITGAVVVFFVSIGGIKSVAYTNAVHALFKYVGVAIAFVVALKMSGGVAHLHSVMKPIYFDWTGMGMPTLVAWTVANIGAVFCTQTVIQAIGSMNDSKKAIQACLLGGILTVPVGFAAAFVGVAAKFAFPKIRGSWSFPQFALSMNPWLGGIVVAALIATVVGSLSATTLGSTALIMRDIYVPWVKPKEKHRLIASRVASIVIGLVPIPFAMYMPELLKTIFFARALRTTITFIVVCLFYAPFFSSGTGVVIALISTILGTTTWYLLKNPFGIDNIYIAFVLPLIVMSVDHLLRRICAPASAAKSASKTGTIPVLPDGSRAAGASGEAGEGIDRSGQTRPSGKV